MEWFEEWYLTLQPLKYYDSNSLLVMKLYPQVNKDGIHKYLRYQIFYFKNTLKDSSSLK